MKKKSQEQKINRLGEEKYNKQGCLMKIVEYNGFKDILVEFQDEYKTKVHTSYQAFLKGEVKNVYYPSVLNVGIIGNKYPKVENHKVVKEYETWVHMIKRCYSEKTKNRNQAYKDTTCCNEWLNYENFYEWLHNQPNFEQWLNGRRWDLDKDILLKGNKVYSSKTCCLVPNYINKLFTKSNLTRGDMPIGVSYSKRNKKYDAKFSNNGHTKHLGYFGNKEDAFQTYKQAKEEYIKQVAQEEYNKGNITKQCYDAMINYEVEITD